MQETEEERLKRAKRELAASRRQVRATYVTWSDQRLISRYKELFQIILHDGWMTEKNKDRRSRSYDVQRFRMVKNEVERRRLEVN